VFQVCKGVALKKRGVRKSSRSLPDRSRVGPSEISIFRIIFRNCDALPTTNPVFQQCMNPEVEGAEELLVSERTFLFLIQARDQPKLPCTRVSQAIRLIFSCQPTLTHYNIDSSCMLIRAEKSG
jgi:hypothetical protein